MAIILLGTCILGSTALNNEEPVSDANPVLRDPVLGVLFSMLSLLFFGLLMISEEVMLKDY